MPRQSKVSDEKKNATKFNLQVIYIFVCVKDGVLSCHERTRETKEKSEYLALPHVLA